MMHSMSILILSLISSSQQTLLLLSQCKPMFASDIAYAGNIEILKSDCFSSSSFFIPPRLATAAATAVAQIFFWFPNIFVLLHHIVHNVVACY